MYLKNLIIKNFRSIKNIKLDFQEGKNIIVGKNNAGKSNVIKALNLVLGESSPTYNKSDNITPDDFYTNTAGISEDEICIICVLKYETTDSIDFDKLNGKGFYSKMAGIFKAGGISLEEYFNTGVLNDKIDEFCTKCFIDVNNSNGSPFIPNTCGNFNVHFNNMDFIFIFKAEKGADGKINKGMKMLFGDVSNLNHLKICSYEIGRNELLQSAILPSFRSPSEQLKLTSYSWYGKLMKHLIEQVDEEAEIQQKFQEVSDLCNSKFGIIQDSIKGSCLEVAFPGAEMSFQFGYNQKHDVYKNTRLFVNDGIETKLEDKGSGIQSAIIIGLFQYYTTEINTLNGALLCVEEPELFLHPHGRRSISDRLDEYVKSNLHNQLIITTHSTEFINTTDGSINIIRLNKNDTDGTIGKNINVTNLKNYLVDGNYNEIFFADKVIFCEGEEKYLIELIYRKQLNDNNVSVIKVGGKENFTHFIGISNKIGIKSSIVADFDFFLRDVNIGSFNSGTYRQDVSKLNDKFLKQYIVDPTELKEKIRTMRDVIKKGKESFFYEGKNKIELCSEEYYVELLKLINELNSYGVGILGGEIEDVVLDKSLLNKGKFNLTSIFELNKKIAGGELIETLIDTTQLTFIEQYII